MKSSWWSKLVIILLNITFWILLFMFILAVRYYDIGNIAFVQQDIDIPLVRIYGNGIVLGVLVGIPYTLMEFYLKNRGIYRYSLGRIMFNRTLIQFIITAAVLTGIAYTNYYMDISNGTIDPKKTGFGKYIFSATVQFLFVGAFLGNIVLGVFRTLQLKIGEEIFYELLVGKYRPAMEENRAFLFLDLKSSTTIAERLGHRKYSFFIQDCFKDLHPAVVACNAMVYQYVGDEAVLTWNSEAALENSNCVRVFYEFDKHLNSRSDYYLKTYGTVPEFKGGLNLGPVMAAEVGVVKREIAYHSDVLNTAARIQGQCNEKNAGLLVSENVIDSLVAGHGYEVVEKGEVLLRGKGERVRIFELKQ
ncbi:MAG: adenylate/guanylate cyclase domain-containing protein [Aurantibacter sp.]